MANLYSEKKPKERIALVIEHNILPVVQSLGFTFRKTDLVLRRVVGDFEQEIWFRPSRNNTGNLVIQFDPHFHVTSQAYTVWLTEQYGMKPDGSKGIGGCRAMYVPGWNKEKYDGWYNLAKDDNERIVELINSNILNAGVVYMTQLSGWASATEFYLKNPGYYFWPNLIDFCLIEGNQERAVEISREFWDVAKENDLLEETYEDMHLRESKLDSLGLLKIDPSKYSHLTKNLAGHHRVFLNAVETKDHQAAQEKSDEEQRNLHLKTNEVNVGGEVYEITQHIASPLSLSPEELKKSKAEAAHYPKTYVPYQVQSNIRFRLNDVAWNRSLQQLATAHDESTGVIWNKEGKVIRIYDFSKDINTGWNNIDSVLPIKKIGFAFGTAHLYFVCDERNVLFQLKNNTKRPTIKNLYFSLLPQFGERITAGFKEGKILSWDYQGNVIFEHICTDKFIPRAYNAQRDIFLLYTDKGVRRVINKNGDILFEYKGPKDNELFLFSPDGNFLAEAGFSSKLMVSDLQKGEVRELKAHATQKKGYARDFDFANFGTNAVAMSPDSKYFAAGCDYGVDVIWRLDTLERINLIGHRTDNDFLQDGTFHIQFSEDAQNLLTANKDSSVILWDVQGIVQAKLVGHTNCVRKAIFGNDEKTIFTISDDMQMRQWKLVE